VTLELVPVVYTGFHDGWTDCCEAWPFASTGSIEQKTRAAKAGGYKCIATTDHSRRLSVVHGLDADRLARQIDEIDRLNDGSHGLTLLRGVEALDLPDSVLSRLDLVVAPANSHFDFSAQKKQTERVIRAMDNHSRFDHRRPDGPVDRTAGALRRSPS